MRPIPEPGRRAMRSLAVACSAALVLGGVTTVAAQTPGNAKAQQDATKLLKQIEAATGSSPPAVKAPTADPCAIVPAAEVKKVFPAAAAAPERSRRLEEYGITECVWKSANGQILLGVQESIAQTPASAQEEALGMAQGIADPLKRDALRNVRIEKFAQLDLDNAAFVETSNPARGILGDGAFMALVKGPQVVTLGSPELPSRDRNDALKALERLGAAASKSLVK